MCGIAGEIRFDNSVPNKSSLKAAADRLEPRGPDSGGELYGANWGFVHRRLSIIDLSSAGHQPMSIDEDGLSIIFNGEIYNYSEIRSELISMGHSFKSHSDTETLLRGYQQWGHRVLHKLNGMFAFCIRDEKQKKYFIARDRLGIKPFYYSKIGNSFVFASNIRSLIAFEGVDTSIDPIALHNYMSLHAIVPEHRTILKGVHKLEPANYIELSFDGDLRQEQYWKADYESKLTLSESQWEEAITEALRKSVKRRLVADVPVGLFLSGGVDSSLITALMCEAGSKDLLTFSVGFAGAQGEAGDEFKYSDIVSEKFKTKHHRFRVDADEMLEHLPSCIRQMNEPMVSYDNIGFYLLSKAAAEHVKVVQSGQGADEVFGGYHWYQKLIESKKPATDYSASFFDRTDQQMKEALTNKYFSKNFTQEYINEYFADANLSAVDHALRVDTHVMLVEDPVKRVDSNTMAFGLEARVPFLDHELIELAAKMPSELKTKDGGKYILKNIARKFVPSEVIDRPKGYFPVPQLKYIQGPFLEFVKKYLSEDSVIERGIFEPDYVNKLLKSPESYVTPLRGSELWQVAVLEIWLKEQGL